MFSSCLVNVFAQNLQCYHSVPLIVFTESPQCFRSVQSIPICNVDFCNKQESPRKAFDQKEIVWNLCRLQHFAQCSIYYQQQEGCFLASQLPGTLLLRWFLFFFCRPSHGKSQKKSWDKSKVVIRRIPRKFGATQLASVESARPFCNLSENFKVDSHQTLDVKLLLSLLLGKCFWTIYLPFHPVKTLYLIFSVLQSDFFTIFFQFW